jgi:ribosomal protein S18 acetylase RimI-like enzyme
MTLDLYNTPREFFSTVMPVIDNNFVSHYQLWDAIDGIIHGRENIEGCCTVSEKGTIHIIHMKTERGHYIFGPHHNKAGTKMLIKHLKKSGINRNTVIIGNRLTVDDLNKELNMGLSIHRNRYHMSIRKQDFREFKEDDSVRVATVNDFSELAPLMERFQIEEFGDERVRSIEDVLNGFHNSLQKPSTYLKANGKTVVCMINVEKYPMDIMYIINIYTLPEFRKKGFSKLALATVMSQLFSGNTLEIGLNVKVENENAI